MHSLFLHVKEKVSKASAQHIRVGVDLVPTPLQSQVFHFALASNSLTILPARSTMQ